MDTGGGTGAGAGVELGTEATPVFVAAVTETLVAAEELWLGPLELGFEAAGAAGGPAFWDESGRTWELVLAAVAADWVRPVVAAVPFGTFPAPGVPIPGKTVPSCKLPRLGCAAEGLESDPGPFADAVGVVADWSPGKFIGGREAGTGMLSAVSSLPATGGGLCCWRWNIPTRGPEAAGGGPLRRAPECSAESE